MVVNDEHMAVPVVWVTVWMLMWFRAYIAFMFMLVVLIMHVHMSVTVFLMHMFQCTGINCWPSDQGI